ncbi:MAG: DNA repair protein RecO [Candidatus Omnitrophica bacterium]|jgi:DNA repair protein RecO (recombination protein O)|nr:DNA repair protein RecO [Candidatus Omnitrophota bacterium]
MAPIKITGLILKKTDFRETSVILNILTEHYGKIAGILKGARNPKKKISPLTYSQGSYIEMIIYMKKISGLDLITQPFLRKYYDFENEKKIFWEKILFSVNSLIPQERIDTESMFSLLIKSGEMLTDIKNLPIFELAFQEKILTFLGFGPFLYKCVQCGNSNTLKFFSGKKGGVLCKQCGQTEPSAFAISESSIEIMRFIDKISYEKILIIKSFPENIYNSIKKCFDSIIAYHISEKKFL